MPLEFWSYNTNLITMIDLETWRSFSLEIGFDCSCALRAKKFPIHELCFAGVLAFLRLLLTLLIASLKISSCHLPAIRKKVSFMLRNEFCIITYLGVNR